MDQPLEPIAIIGLAGRFPGAADAQQLWRNLLAGDESIRFPSADDLLLRGVSPAALADPSYVKAVAEPDGIDMFDAEFFGLTRREAELCDPQLRLYLESSHAAVENAGYDPATLGRAGVFASVAANRYWVAHFDGPLDALRSATGMSTGMWNNPESASTLVSYKLNLAGPSMTVQTACSSSLVAVHLAVNALRLDECDVALAGGADVEFPVGHGYWWAQDGPLSRDGRCRPFDAAASGTIFGSGVGVVVLKRLTDALADGDHIYATVRAVAVNNDGASKVGFTAPSAHGQADVVRRAMALAGVGPADIGYVEAHATGTRLGDPIEIAALTDAFDGWASSARATEKCLIGSVKGNVGHLGHAAGITSLIKTALSLDQERIPASINCAEVNPLMDLRDSPFVVNDTVRSWPRSVHRRRCAGVSSFGIGGTNSHAILEEAPARAAEPAPDGAHVVVWSGRTRSVAETYRERLARFADGSVDPLSSVSFTLREGRAAHPVRGAVVADSTRDAAAALRDPSRTLVTPEAGGGGSVVFLFPGQGAQHPHMAMELYQTESAFSAPFDECLDLFEAQGLPIRETWRATSANLDDTIVAQPLLFGVEYALGRMWLALGIEPDALLGHSVGEFAAATLAGVFSLPDAAHLVSARARAMSESPSGAMLAVAADMDSVSRLLFGSLGVAVVNSDRQTVVAGSPEDVRRLAEEILPGAGLASSRLRPSHAFHTAAMAGASKRFRSAFDDIEPLRPRWQLYSAATGGPVETAQVTDPEFWVRQLTEPVWYGRALDAVLSDADRVLLEVGPGWTLTALAHGHSQVRAKRHVVIPTLPSRRSEPGSERRSMLQALARMWTLGKDVTWSALAAPDTPRRVPLPGYPYERARYWAGQTAAAASGPVSGARAERADPGALLRLPTWLEDTPAGYRDVDVRGQGRALVFLPDDARRASQVAVHLQEAGLDVLTVRQGPQFSQATDEFVVRPRHPGDVVRLLEALRDARRHPDLVVDAMTLGDLAGPDLRGVDRQLESGFHRIVALLQEAARYAPDKRSPNVLLITELSADVTGGETAHPVRAMLHGLARTYVLENPHATCKLVDVGRLVSGTHLVAEFRNWARSEIVALRGDRRWVPGERELVIEGAPVDLRRRGAYVITGGLGGLGLAVARGLAETGLEPRLLLLSRRATGGQSGALAEIRALGAECRVEQCDVTDVDALRGAIDRASARFGHINGVLHLAGVPGGGMLQFRTREQMSATLAPKVHGALALTEVFKDRQELDFFVAFSSRAALSGLVGSADYAAANAFLDALVRQEPLAGCHAMSINWPSWAAVGMAARQAAHPRGEPAGSDGGVRRWSTTLSVDDYPILDEHRLDGIPVLPGTAQVDFVLRAFRAAVEHDSGRAVRIRNVVFRQPITADDPISLEISFEPHEDRWRFSVRSAPLSSTPPGSGYHVNTTGEIQIVDTKMAKVDLDGLLSSLPGRRIPANESVGRLFTIGPRWPREEVCFAPEETGRRLVMLTFPQEFAPELDGYALHPTLLDAAVSSARDSDHELPHAPFGYESIVVHRSLPSFAYSYVRRRPSGTDTIVADIDVLTPAGDVAVEVKGFTMRRVDESMVATEAARRMRYDDPEETTSAESGIAPDTGVELLLRLLGQPSLRQVAVTLPGEDAVLKNAGHQDSTADGGRTTAVAERYAAPGESGPGVVDGPPVEARLRKLWSAAFGVEEVDLDDDFFELGGDSLTAVGLMDDIRREFGVEVGIAAIFEFRTVAELAAELSRRKG